MCFWAALTQLKPPFKDTAITWSHWDSRRESMKASCLTPALETRISTLPKEATALANRASMVPLSVTSPGKGMALLPMDFIFSVTLSAAIRLRSLATISAPSPANLKAIPRPISPAAPVMTATLPSSLILSPRDLSAIDHPLPENAFALFAL